MILLETLIPISRKTRRLPHLGPKATLTIEKKINPLNEYWIRHAQEVLMTLPASGQLSLTDIQNEQGGSGQASLGDMSDIAGFIAPDQVSDFYSYTYIVWVQWQQPSLGTATLVGSPQYRYDSGTWTNFAGTRTDTSVTAATVGYQFTANFGSSGGGSAACGPTAGSSAYGLHSSSVSPGNFTFHLDSVATSQGTIMYFTGSTS